MTTTGRGTAPARRDEDDDDDEAPAARRSRRAHDDDDDYDRPRRRSRREEDEASGNMTAVLIAGGVLAAIIIVGVVVILVVRNRGDKKDTTPADPAAPGVTRPDGSPALPVKAALAATDADFEGRWPAMNIPANAVVVRIIRVEDQNLADAISERLEALTPATNFRSSSAIVLPRMMFALSPVSNIQEFARKIDFGKVVSIGGGFINVAAFRIPGPPTEPIARALHDLNRRNPVHRRQGLDALKNVPEDRLSEVLQALEPLLDDADEGRRDDVAEVYCRLATSDRVPTLIRIVGRDQKGNRAATSAMKALARLKDLRGIAPIAARLVNLGGRGEAKDALIAYGSEIEPEIIKLLGSSNNDTRVAACEILGKIGTNACVPALQQATKDQNFFFRVAADRALKELQKR